MKSAVRILASWITLGVLIGCACGAASAGFLYALAAAIRLSRSAPGDHLRAAGRRARDRLALRSPRQADRGQHEPDPRHAARRRPAPAAADGADGADRHRADAPVRRQRRARRHRGADGRQPRRCDRASVFPPRTGSVAGRRLSLGWGCSPALRRQLLAAGIAGGFGSVFGTPLAGALFGLEVVTVGRMEYAALVPALVAAVVGDLVTRGLGIVHTAYPHDRRGRALDPLARAASGSCSRRRSPLTATAFVEATHAVKRAAATIKYPALRLAAGGVLVVGAWQLLGTRDELGLGVPMIVRAVRIPGCRCGPSRSSSRSPRSRSARAFSAARSRRFSSSARRSATCSRAGSGSRSSSARASAWPRCSRARRTRRSRCRSWRSSCSARRAPHVVVDVGARVRDVRARRSIYPAQIARFGERG